MPKIINQFQVIGQNTSEMMMLWSKLATANIKQFNKTIQCYTELYQKEILIFNNPSQLLPALSEYAIDFLQRYILFLDIMRKRGNQYLEHISAGQPPVLIFNYKMILDGRTFEKPVNYALVEIEPPQTVKIDKNKRPYVIVDPRAGHGSGIGGFKDDSQVGVALRAGHPVYFVIFFPEPEPNQTIHDITIAEEKFMRKVAERHAISPKPCIIGNCQGGWAVMALAAAHPDIASMIVINGAPLSYWSGENGKNPMRYMGGMLGGGWLAQFSGDLGNGLFDGAHLVLNFELLNPSNSFWKKYYDLFTKIDENEKYFLDFERWWGGFSLMNTKEIRTIVDNLFIGNKLSHGKIPLDEMNNIDLRNIHLPIIIFCSEADNITPPQQALNWIADIYPNVMELKLAGQTIVYLVHQSAGHLGIFVSSQVAKKEHKQIIDLLNYVEHLPPGLYEMIIQEESCHLDDPHPYYIVSLKERTIDDLMINYRPENKKTENLLKIVHALSDYNAMSYDLFISPWVRAGVNEHSAAILREIHPLRMGRYLLSDLNPSLAWLAFFASYVHDHRKPVQNNPFLDIQHAYSEMIISLLDLFREGRDANAELLFNGIYRSLDIALPTHLPFRDRLIPFIDSDNQNLDQHIISIIEDGGVPAAIIRIFLLLIKTEGLTRANYFAAGVQLLKISESMKHLSDKEYSQLLHQQSIIVEYDPALALETLPELLKTKKDHTSVLKTVENVLQAANVVLPEKAFTLHRQIEKLLTK